MRTSLLFLCAACLGLTACSRPKSPGYQGYLEGEFVYVGAPLGGQLEKLAVIKGTRIPAGALLFTLEHANELAAQLTTAGLGARPDALAAAMAEVSAAAAAKERAGWAVAQKSQAAPRAALVFDTLYRVGEFVAAGNPVVSLLPAENIKVRFFVPEAEFAAFTAGAPVRIAITGRPAPLDARISYLSPSPEYTPPILYNRENRSKLVFMVEAVFTDATAARDLHPGQPVDVLK